MVIPSLGSTAAFVVLVLTLAGLFVVGVWRSGQRRGDTPSTIRVHTSLAAGFVAAYLAATAGAAASGLLRIADPVPVVMLFVVACNLVAIALALSAVGMRFARHLPLWALVGFQVFRLPLELVLHRWHLQGTLPVQMTFAGRNFDIISGIAGGLLGFALWRGWPIARRTAVWLYNGLGFGLLLAVVSIAILSAPVPPRRFFDGPAVQLPLHAPYVWIVSICVGGALFGHLVVFRALLLPHHHRAA